MRCFVALELPLALRRELWERARPLREELPAARWVAPEAMHLTLAFLGEVEAEQVGELDAPLARACATAEPLELRLGPPGVFPPRRRPRVLWTGLQLPDGGDATPALAALHGCVSAAVMGALGLEPEGRPFRPHLTLARLREGGARIDRARFAESLADPPRTSFEVREAVLFESLFGAGGARYRALRRFPFRGPGDGSSSDGGG